MTTTATDTRHFSANVAKRRKRADELRGIVFDIIPAQYARLSQDPSKEGVKVQRQLENGAQFLARQAAISPSWRADLVSVYSDNDKSASTDEIRPGFEKLLESLSNFDAIVCWQLDRLVRTITDLGRIKRFAITAHKVDFYIVVSDTGRIYNVLDSDDFLNLTNLTATAEAEGGKKSKRITNNTDARRRSGEIMRYRILGYKRRSGKVIPDEAKVVVEIFDRFNRGESILSIIAWLNSADVKKPSAKHSVHDPKWTRHNVRGILRNPRYIAKTYTYDDSINYRTIKGDGKWESIIDRQSWDNAQERLDGSPLHRGGNARKHLGTNFYVCGICGGLMISAVHGQGHPDPATGLRNWNRAYKCRTSTHLIRQGAEDIDDYVIRSLEVFLRDKALVRAAANRTDNSNQIEIRELREKIAQRKQDILSLTEKIASNPLVADELIAAIGRIKEENAARQARIATLDAEDGGKDSLLLESLLRDAKPFELWSRLSVPDQARVASLLVAVTINPVAKGRKPTGWKVSDIGPNGRPSVTVEPKP